MRDDAATRARPFERPGSSTAARDAGPATEQLLTVPEVAKRLCVSEKFVRRLVWAHELRHHRLGRAIRIPSAALAEYLEQTEVRCL